MLYPKESFAVIAGVSTDETRPALNGVFLEKDGSTIATNGHVMFIMPAQKSFNDMDFPHQNQKHAQPNGKQIVNRTVVADIIKSFPRKSSIFPILQCAQLVKNGSKNPAFLITDLDTDKNFSGFLEGSYPNYKQVWPKTDTKRPERQPYQHPCRQPQTPQPLEIGISTESLKKMCQFIDKAGSCLGHIKLIIRQPNQAIEFEATVENDHGQKPHGLIMPLRLEQ